jgi:hypothetical protein
MRILTIILSLFYITAFAEEDTVQKMAENEVKVLNSLAQQGNAGAQYKLGFFYEHGNGQVVLADPVEAVKWYRKSAEQGVAQAQYKLGYCYYHGVGVLKDPVEAVKWYHKAAEQGFVDAQLFLVRCYDDGIGVPKNSVEADKWFRWSAEYGDVNAQYNLGRCYSVGERFTKDVVEAYAYYNLAGITLEVARGDRDKLERTMTPSQREAGLKRSRELQVAIEANKKAYKK